MRAETDRVRVYGRSRAAAPPVRSRRGFADSARRLPGRRHCARRRVRRRGRRPPSARDREAGCARDQEHSGAALPPAPRGRRRAGGRRARRGPRRAGDPRAGRHRRSRRREPALLSTARLPHARDRARRVHGGDRLSARQRGGRRRASRPRLARPQTMSAPSNTELYVRGIRTLLASWEVYAGGSEGAAVVRGAGVAAGVFPAEPQRGVYNNAVLERGLGACARAAAVDAMEAAYASAGIPRFAAWVHESDAAMREDVEARGYTLQESTCAMGLALS